MTMLTELVLMSATVSSFDAAKASRYLERAMMGFLGDPPDSDYQQGFLAALLTVYREGLNKGAQDERLALLDEMTRKAK